MRVPDELGNYPFKMGHQALNNFSGKRYLNKNVVSEFNKHKNGYYNKEYRLEGGKEIQTKFWEVFRFNAS